MRKIALVIALSAVSAVSAAPAVAQKAKIEAVNAKWVELFGKGDFEGIAQLYTVDATAFPPGSAMVKGRAPIGAMWKGLAEHVSNPKLTTLDVKRLSTHAAREIGTFSLMTKDPTPKEISGKFLVCKKFRGEWKLAADIWNDGK
jgi:ketosteroid isomerase-like protein